MDKMLINYNLGSVWNKKAGIWKYQKPIHMVQFRFHIPWQPAGKVEGVSVDTA